MKYEDWREDIFGNKPDSDPVNVELLSDTYELSFEEIVDYVDTALSDAEIHQLYSKEQIGIGLNLIYSNSCSDIPFCYLEIKDNLRKVKAIENLKYLYTNYFEKYCLGEVRRIGYDQADGLIGNLCYMLWDIFVLYPGNASKEMKDAVILVLKNALNSSNDNCIVSALHGLGHWVYEVPVASEAIEKWLSNPTTKNEEIIQYASQAKTGCIQ